MVLFLGVPISGARTISTVWLLFYITAAADISAVQEIQQTLSISLTPVNRLAKGVYLINLNDSQMETLLATDQFRIAEDTDFSDLPTRLSVIETRSGWTPQTDSGFKRLAPDLLIVDNTILSDSQNDVLNIIPVRTLRLAEVATPSRSPTSSLYAPPALPASLIAVIVVSSLIVASLIATTLAICCMSKRHREECKRKPDFKLEV